VCLDLKSPVNALDRRLGSGIAGEHIQKYLPDAKFLAHRCAYRSIVYIAGTIMSRSSLSKEVAFYGKESFEQGENNAK
jgi:hypothetical protein